MTPRDRLVLVAGALVIVTAWTGLRGVPRALAWARLAEERTAQQITLLERARRETSALPALSDSISALEEVAASLHRLLLLGEDPQTAAFDLTRRLTETLNRTASFVESIVPVPDSVSAAQLDRVTVRANLETDILGFAEISRRIEADSVMAIAGLRVAATALDSPRTEIERLQVSLAVTGWYRPSAGAPDTATAPEAG